jgi:hypothetical protein
VAAKYTYKQGQYLAYIFHYTKIHRRPPAVRSAAILWSDAAQRPQHDLDTGSARADLPHSVDASVNWSAGALEELPKLD